MVVDSVRAIIWLSLVNLHHPDLLIFSHQQIKANLIQVLRIIRIGKAVAYPIVKILGDLVGAAILNNPFRPVVDTLAEIAIIRMLSSETIDLSLSVWEVIFPFAFVDDTDCVSHATRQFSLPVSQEGPI